MSKEKGFSAILIVIVTCILINIGISTYDSINQKRLIKEAEESYEDYKSSFSRFPIKINEGEYKVIEYGENCLIYNENGVKLFDEASKLIYLNEINTKYSEYIITEYTTYVCADIENVDNYMQYIEYPVSISDNALKNLRAFMREIDNDSINVIPFNDGIHCFITGNSEQYIFNIENGELLWTRGNYYESPTFNPAKDTLTCGGDLSSTHYVFNKYGELLETRENGIIKGVIIHFIVSILAVFAILLIIQQMVYKNVKSIAIKIMTNIFTIGGMLLITVIVLWLVAII